MANLSSKDSEKQEIGINELILCRSDIKVNVKYVELLSNKESEGIRFHVK